MFIVLDVLDGVETIDLSIDPGTRDAFPQNCVDSAGRALANADRLLDATRAATILAVYKYSLARYHEGWMMAGRAAR